MAADRYSMSTGSVATTAAATKSLILLNPVTSGINITELWIGFDGSAAAAGVGVQLYRTTTVGTPAGTTGTVVKEDPSSAATNGTTGLTALTTEPTAVEVLRDIFLPPNGGALVIEFPLGREPVAAPAGQRIGLRYITPSAVSPNARATLVWEE